MVVITLSGFMQSSATGWRGGSANAFSPSHSRRSGAPPSFPFSNPESSIQCDFDQLRLLGSRTLLPTRLLYPVSGPA